MWESFELLCRSAAFPSQSLVELGTTADQAGQSNAGTGSWAVWLWWLATIRTTVIHGDLKIIVSGTDCLQPEATVEMQLVRAAIMLFCSHFHLIHLVSDNGNCSVMHCLDSPSMTSSPCSYHPGTIPKRQWPYLDWLMGAVKFPVHCTLDFLLGAFNLEIEVWRDVIYQERLLIPTSNQSKFLILFLLVLCGNWPKCFVVLLPCDFFCIWFSFLRGSAMPSL